MGKKAIFLLLILSHQVSFAQKILRGKVFAADNKQPVIAASIFISNTTTGTISNDQGDFTLERLPEGKFDLIVTSLGYETYVQTLQSGQIPEFLSIALKPKPKDLGEVIVEPYEKNGWGKWGKFFTEMFIGLSPFANDCEIKNTNVIQFRNSKKKNMLEAFADETLIIENRSLGYIIQYKLERFEYDFKRKTLIYAGYPLFEEMVAKRRSIERRWIRNRKLAYYGSLTHFLRALYRNKLPEEGFEVRRIIKQKWPEGERERIQALYKSNIRMQPNGTASMGSIDPDSSAYYQKVLNFPDGVDFLINKILPGDSIAYAINKTTAVLKFTDYLQINYRRNNGIMQYDRNGKVPPVSGITLINHDSIEVFANGNYYDAVDLLSMEHWAWREKIATMLPNDYKP